MSSDWISLVSGLLVGAVFSWIAMMAWLRHKERSTIRRFKANWDPAYAYFRSEVERLIDLDPTDEEWLDLISRYLKLNQML